jgi:hypothetical protein
MSDEKGHRSQYYEPPAPSGSARIAAARAGLALAAAALAALALAACGSGERSFGAEDFIEEANAHGASLELGEPLSTSEADVELYALTIEEPEEEDDSGDEPAIEHEHGGGSLRVTDSVDDAEAEVSRCEQAVSLFCYRAANIVLILEQDADPEALSDLAGALRALEE